MTEARVTSSAGTQRLVVLAAYAVLGSLLLLTRLVGLGHSLWFDELFFVEHFVREGPREILAGSDLSHELYGVLAWAASTALGESEQVLRLLSSVPFVAGVVLVTGWLDRRLGASSGILFLFLATASPLLLDLSRQARGYGLAFLAMSVMVVAALEASRTGTTWLVLVTCAAGVLGTWTLPQFGIAFVTTGLALLTVPSCRRAAVLGMAASLAAIGAWYAPHLAQLRSVAQAEGGFQISTTWLVTAPVDQILIPALLWIEGVALFAGVVWLPLVAIAVIVIAASPLLRERTTALILCGGVVVTIVAVWALQSYIFTRYFSYLLVPSFMLLASGAASILVRTFTRREATVRGVVCLAAVALVAWRFVTVAPDVVRLPREANRDAAEAIAAHTEPGTPVLAYVLLPEGLEFYVDRRIEFLSRSEVAARVCGSDRQVAYVMQPMVIQLVTVPCLERTGVRHFRFRQYARGGEMNVWLVPPG